VEIGIVHSIGSDLLVSYKQGSATPFAYGVDELDYTAKYASPYITTINLAPNRYISKSFKKYIVGYKSKPTGTDITLSYLKNTATPVTITLRDKTDEQHLEGHDQIDGGLFQLKITASPSSNSAPEIDELAITYEPKLL